MLLQPSAGPEDHAGAWRSTRPLDIKRGTATRLGRWLMSVDLCAFRWRGLGGNLGSLCGVPSSEGMKTPPRAEIMVMLPGVGPGTLAVSLRFPGPRPLRALGRSRELGLQPAPLLCPSQMKLLCSRVS